jgi:hypothetical protein
VYTDVAFLSNLLPFAGNASRSCAQLLQQGHPSYGFAASELLCPFYSEFFHSIHRSRRLRRRSAVFYSTPITRVLCVQLHSQLFPSVLARAKATGEHYPIPDFFALQVSILELLSLSR